jgi:ABC-type amino acid transport substrate-binding protein
MRLGYRDDAAPFSYGDQSGNAAGYSIVLCQAIAEAVKRELRLPALQIEWVPVTTAGRFLAVQQGTIDILCGADAIAAERRAQVSLSTPIFPGGIGALLRSDAPVRLRDVLTGHRQTFAPTWRAAPSQVPQARAFSAVGGTPAEKWLTRRIRGFEVLTKVSPVENYDAGVEALLAGRVDALFGERDALLDRARRHVRAADLVVLDRFFTYEPLALALPRNDEEFRVFVDRALGRFYSSPELAKVYRTWFGEPDSNTLAFFRWNTQPD